MHIRDHGDGHELDILVAPRASRPRIGPLHDDRLKIAVSAPPVEGAANQAVLDLLARTLRLPRTGLTVLRGDTSRRKTILIQGATRAALETLGR
jgi:uncharacterized protein (TIGR00251 family)